MISVFGVILPSVDQGSDYYTIAILIDYGFECHSRCVERDQDKEDSRVRSYGYAMLAPILLMTIFSLRQWWRLEKIENRLRTLPLVFMQFFPQYRALRILYLGLKKRTREYREEINIYDRDLTSLGMYVLTYVLYILLIQQINQTNLCELHVSFSRQLSDFLVTIPQDCNMNSCRR